MDVQTRIEIEKENRIILKEIGIKNPPISVEDVLEHLKLHRRFYNLEDPDLLERFWHKVKIQKCNLFNLVRKKAKIVAMWFPSESQIYIDSCLPKPKQKWATHHEVEHRILTWHRAFYLGDTVQTLDPEYQEMLEEEANYGTSYLMFCGGLFTIEALDTKPEWASIKLLSQRYSNSLVTTLRRYVVASHEIPMAAFINTPHWQEKPENQLNRWRHFVKSSKFISQFGNIHPSLVLDQINSNIIERRGGIVGDFSIYLEDINGDMHEFYGESFYNTYDVLTLIVYKKQVKIYDSVVV